MEDPSHKDEETNEPEKLLQKKYIRKLIVLSVASIITLTFVHYGTCMFHYRWVEWQFYQRLIDSQGIDKIKTVDLSYLTDPACVDVNHTTSVNLASLLATILALKGMD